MFAVEGSSGFHTLLVAGCRVAEVLLKKGWADYIFEMSKNSQPMSYPRKSTGILLLVGVLAGVTVGGGVGVFAASSINTVTVCANKKTNLLRYAKSGKCAKTETKVVLNQTGTNGTNGTAGAKGETGAAGPAGSSGSGGGASAPAATGTNCIASKCTYKIGDTGPGGGHIFFVDYNDQYTGFDYLEAAPSSCEGTGKTWSSDTTNSLDAAHGWAARAVGAGKANSAAMIANGATSYLADISGAASFAESSTCGTRSDWFLGSLGELKLMNDNLQGVGGFAPDYYWSSSEGDANNAVGQDFSIGAQGFRLKTWAGYVRPVRAF